MAAVVMGDILGCVVNVRDEVFVISLQLFLYLSNGTFQGGKKEVWSVR